MSQNSWTDMPHRPHPDHSRAIALLRTGKTPKEVLALLPAVGTSTLYRWMKQSGLPTPGVRDRPLTARSLDILSALASNPGVQTSEVAAIWNLSRQRISALRAKLREVKLTRRSRPVAKQVRPAAQ